MPNARLVRNMTTFKWITTIGVAALIVVLFVNARVNSDAVGQKVAIVAVNCAQDGNQIPSLYREVGAALAGAPRELSSGVHRFDVILPPGSYTFRVSTTHHDSKPHPEDCNAIASFTVLKGHDRHLVVGLETGIAIGDADCSIAGTLPIEGLAIGLVRRSGGEIPAVVDGGAYYFDNLTPRRYVVRIRFSTGTHADMPVDLSDSRHPTSGILCSGKNAIRNRFRNISLAELANLARTATFNSGEYSAPQPTGVDATAKPTWPYKFANIEYSVATSPDVSATRRKMADFDIYTFTLGDRVVLSAYVGNDPAFPMFSHNEILDRNHDSINDLRAVTIIYRAPAGTKTRETLVTLNQKPHTWGQYIHFYYSNVSLSDSNEADEIISSLESLAFPSVSVGTSGWSATGIDLLLASATAMTFDEKTAPASASPSHLIPFGYKTAWFAIRSCDSQKVATALGLTNIRSATWQAGIDALDEEEAHFTVTSAPTAVFVTPPVNGWTFALGFSLLKNAKAHSSELPTETLKKLSEICGEAQFYASNRVVDVYSWSRAKNGTVLRSYEYDGSEGETLTNSGALTPIEQGINFQSLDEDDVLKVAGAWSIDPSKLDEAISTAPGLLGQIHATQ